jgi:hypothetical protein
MKHQLDLKYSSSRIPRLEKSKFKIIEAKENKKRYDKAMSLNSKVEPESVDEIITAKQEFI